MANFPINWTQEASNNLGAIARNAVRQAEELPDDWVNPFYGKMRSSVMYEEDTGYFVVNFCNPGGRLMPLHRTTAEEASQELKNGWGHEQGLCASREGADDEGDGLLGMLTVRT